MTKPQLAQLATQAGVTDAAALAWLTGGSVTARSADKLEQAHQALYPRCCPCSQCRGRERAHPGGRIATTQQAILSAILEGADSPRAIWTEHNFTPTGCYKALGKLKRDGIVDSRPGPLRVVDIPAALHIIRRAEERGAA